MRTTLCAILGLLLLATAALSQSVPGNSLPFNGTSNYVAAPVVDLSGSALTIEYWFKGANPQSAVRQQDLSDTYIVAGWGWPSVHILWNDGGTGDGLPVGAAATDGRWHHVAMTWQQNTVGGFCSYLDGQLVAARTSINTPIPQINGNLILGSYFGTSEFTNGTLDEVRIWKLARSQAEIQANMNDTITASTPGLEAYYRFDQTSGDTLYDLTSNVYHGVLNNFSGTPWTASYAMVRPTATAASNATTTGFDANWTAPLLGGTPDGYRIDVAADSLFTAMVSGWNNYDAGTSTTAAVTGLTGGSIYYYRVRAVKGADTSQSSNAINAWTSGVTPTTQATSLTFSGLGPASFKVNWTDGDGTFRAVFVKEGSGGTASPVDNTTYTAQTAFGSGSQIGSTGWYCVFNGSGHGTPVRVINLAPAMTYTVMVCEYSGAPGDERYLTSTAAGNPGAVTTTTPISGTVEVGSGKPYPTLTMTGGLFDSINLNGISGNLTALITSDLNEDGTVSLKQIFESGAGGYTVTIRPDAKVPRLIEGASVNDTGMIRLDGAVRVVIDGDSANTSSKFLRFRNTYTGGPTISFINGACYDTIRNCVLEGTAYYTKKNGRNTWQSNLKLPEGGNARARKAAIENAKRQWHEKRAKDGPKYGPYYSVVLFGPSDGATGNSYDALVNNQIRNLSTTGEMPEEGVICAGTGGLENAGNAITGNEIFNFNYYGVDIDNDAGDGWAISNNHLYWNAADTMPENYPYGIAFWPDNGSKNHVISGNYIGGTAPYCGGSPWLIKNGYGYECMDLYPGTSGTMLIQNNVMQNIRAVGGGSQYLEGIYTQSGVFDIIGNTIGHPSDSSKGLFFDGADGWLWPLEANADIDRVVGNTVANVWCTSKIPPYLELFEPGSTTLDSLAGNKAYSCGYTDSATGSNYVVGIENDGGSNDKGYVINNMISLGQAHCTNPYYGIADWGGSGDSLWLYYNTVYLGGMNTGTNYTTAFEKSSYAAVIARNNVFCNARQDSLNYAINQDISDGSLASDYNLLLAEKIDSLACADVSTTPLSFTQWRNITGQDKHSWADTIANAPPESLFADPAGGDLRIRPASPCAWYANGKGVQVPGVAVDIDGNSRSTTVATGGTDIGCSEFTATSLPPAVTCTPGLNTDNQFFFAERELGSILWGGAGTVPTSATLRHYTGDNPPLPHNSGALFGNCWWDISVPDGSGYSYDLRLCYDPALLGAIPDEANIILSKQDGGSWAYFTGGYTLDIDGDSITIYGLNSLSAFALSDSVHPLAVELAPPSAVERYGLSQTCPNPFSERTTVRYQLGGPGRASLKVYNLAGQLVKTVVDRVQPAGAYTAKWNGRNESGARVAAGIYIYRLTVNGFSATRKMTILR